MKWIILIMLIQSDITNLAFSVYIYRSEGTMDFFYLFCFCTEHVKDFGIFSEGLETAITKLRTRARILGMQTFNVNWILWEPLLFQNCQANPF